MSWICNFLLKTTQDHLGPSPGAIGSTWFCQKPPFLAPWKSDQIGGSKSIDVSKWHNSYFFGPILACSISKWPYRPSLKNAILQKPSSQRTNQILSKRGQTFEADFLHEFRGWMTSFFWPRRSGCPCRLRFIPKSCWHSLGKLIFFNFCDF